jgi:hypothetical protein
MCFTFAACGGDSDNGSGDSSSNGSDKAASSNDPALEKYVADVIPQLESIIESTKAHGMELSVSARGSAFVYTNKYTNKIEDVDAARDALSAQEATLKVGADAVRPELEAAGVKSPSVIYEYINSDGTEIYSKEFKKE